MNRGLYLQLREIDNDLARDYDRVNSDMESLEPRVGREFLDDIDALVDGLLGKITELEKDVYGLRAQRVRDSEE